MSSLPVWPRRLTVAMVIVVVIIAGVSVLYNLAKPEASAQLGTGVFRVDVMRTESERERGLSGRDSLAADRAMLFVFPHDDTWGIWMKDMHFPIDIIWLDKDKNIVYTKQNVTPDSYPTTYQPDKKARYIIELAAGTMKDKNIRNGMSAKFDITGETQ